MKYPLLSLGVGFWLLFSSPVLAKPANVGKFFAPILPRLKQSRAIILLPTYIPGLKGEKLYPVLDRQTPTGGGYAITIGYSPDCNGGFACRFGTITVEKIVPSMPSIAQLAADTRDYLKQPDLPARSQDVMGSVTLANGIKAYFIPWTAGANCSDANVLWEQQGYRYTVGLKCATKQNVVDMAGSMVKVPGTSR